jgi:hypothetical protein
MGVIGNHHDDGVLGNIRARGKCRRIVAENNVVKVYFLSSEDAKIFAKDLKIVIEE